MILQNQAHFVISKNRFSDIKNMISKTLAQGRLSLALDNVSTLQKSRARNMHAIYARSEGSVESAYLQRLA